MTFSENTCLEKERVRSKVIPRKVGEDINGEWLNKRRRDRVWLVGDPLRRKKPRIC